MGWERTLLSLTLNGLVWDDLHVVCQPAREAEVHAATREELWRHATISLHHGKTDGTVEVHALTRAMH